MNKSMNAITGEHSSSEPLEVSVPPAGNRGELDVARSWRKHLLVFVPLLVATMAIFGSTYWSMVITWWRSETFAHGFIVVPISVYLIWRKRAILGHVAPAGSRLALVALAVLGAAWLLGHAADVLGVQQLAVTLVIPALVALIFGWRVVRVLAFPLGFLLLAVPIGEFLVPPLIDFTASFTVHAVQLSGVPVFWEGNRLSLPTGDWSVVKACSGVRYLYATLTVALLYAYLNYRSRWRQALFVVIAVGLAIFANGVRAYAIVMIGHLSEMRLAVGVDHFIYGWVFFGLLMVLLFWIGSFLRENDHDVQERRSHNPESVRAPGSSRRALASGLVGFVVLAAFPAWALHLQSKMTGMLEANVQLATVGGGWRRTVEPNITDWRPVYVNPTATVANEYGRGDERVGLFVAYYGAQRQGSELINFRNVLVEEKDAWHVVDRRPVTLKLDGETRPAKESRLRSPAGDLLVWQWYWVNGSHLDSPYLVKMYEALDKLTAGRRRGAGVVVYTPVQDSAESARQRLQAFAANAIAPLDRALASAEASAR